MKIIQVSSYYPPHLGGGDNVVRAISEYLSRKGHSVTVLTSNIGTQNNKLKSSKNLQINYLKSVEFAHSSIIFPLFYKLITLDRKSIIHVHVGHGYVPEIVYLSTLFTKIPYIAHFHLETEPTGKFGFILPFYKKFVLRKVLFNAKYVIVPTHDYIKIVHEKYGLPINKIKLISNGINLSNYKISNLSKKNNLSILFVGRLSTQKNVATLITAFKELTNKNKNIILDIVGDGEEKDNLTKLVSDLNIENLVRFHGIVTGDKLNYIYHDADIFVLPSLYESFGLVLLEAMASGVPILASDILAIRNVIKDQYNGLLVLPKKIYIRNKLEILINDKLLRKTLSNNAKRDVIKYDWDIILPDLETLYLDILNKHK